MKGSKQKKKPRKGAYGLPEFSAGWYQFVYLAGAIIVAAFLGWLSISPYATSAVSFYYGLMGAVIALIVAAIAVQYATGGPGVGISILPIGQHDPDTYPLQKIFGYNGAWLWAIVFGLTLAFLFGSGVSTSKQVYVPVTPLFTQDLSFQPGTNQILSISAGGSAYIRGAADAQAATTVENPLFLFGEMMVIWLAVRYFLEVFIPGSRAQIFGSSFANWTGIIAGVLIASWIFPNVFHNFAYQGITPAYERAQFFAMAGLILTALTGFPIPLDMAHFANNYAAAVGGAFSVMAMPIVGSVFPVLKANYIKQIQQKGVKK